MSWSEDCSSEHGLIEGRTRGGEAVWPGASAPEARACRIRRIHGDTLPQ